MELLRKAADKFLAHYQKQGKSGKSNDEISSPILSSNEIDALEYLGGYALHNLHNKLVKKGNNDALDILDCFKSEGVQDLPLINLQSRGGLTGGMVDMLIYEVQVISCYTTYSQLLENIDEELLLNVVESMFTLYLRVRSFSYVRELAAEKKKENRYSSKKRRQERD